MPTEIIPIPINLLPILKKYIGNPTKIIKKTIIIAENEFKKVMEIDGNKNKINIVPIKPNRKSKVFLFTTE